MGSVEDLRAASTSLTAAVAEADAATNDARARVQSVQAAAAQALAAGDVEGAQAAHDAAATAEAKVSAAESWAARLREQLLSTNRQIVLAEQGAKVPLLQGQMVEQRARAEEQVALARAALVEAKQAL